MKLRDKMLWLVVATAAGLTGCAVCDTCDDFPAPCVGPNCAGNSTMTLDAMQGSLPVMGAATPTYTATDDSAGPAPTTPSMPAVPSMPAAPAVNPAPAGMSR